MIREQRADALLCAAKNWQTIHDCTPCHCTSIQHLFVDETMSPMDGWGMDVLASAALSEVAGMGYDLESVEP